MSELSEEKKDHNLIGDNMEEIYPPDYQEWLDSIDSQNDSAETIKEPPF